MADSTPSSRKGNRCTLPHSEDPRKKQKSHPPDFSDPTSLVTFVVIEDNDSDENEDGERGGEGDTLSEKIETKFLVHKEVACYHSPVLHAAFTSGFVEGQTQTYRLEDTTARAFKFLMQWLYYKEIRAHQLEEDFIDDSTAKEDEDRALVELWVLGDKLCMPLLQNSVLTTLDKIIKRAGTIPTYCLNFIYENTSSDSLLRQYFVSVVGLELDPSFLKDSPLNFPHQMLLELAAFLMEKLGDNDSAKVSQFFVPID